MRNHVVQLYRGKRRRSVRVTTALHKKLKMIAKISVRYYMMLSLRSIDLDERSVVSPIYYCA